MVAGMDFGKQVGPLPLGAWVAVVAGGLGIAYYSSRNSGNDEPIYVNDTSGNAGVGMGGVGAYTSTDGGNSPVTSGQGAIESNQQWGQAAFTYLVSMGTDGAVADKAVRDFLQGLPLSLQYNALISLCLTRLGQPPERIPDAPALPVPPKATPTPVPTPSKPAPKPAPPKVATPAPKAQRRYTVQRGDSLWKIAAHFYGAGSKWPTIYNANRAVIGGNPNRIFAGQVYVIP